MDIENNESMGAKIKKLRTEKEMTLEQVGDIVGVGKSTVRKWENGMIANMRRDKIDKLATALDVSPGFLMGWEDDPPKLDLYTKRMFAYFEKMSSTAIKVGQAYDAADDGIKAAVDKLLDIGEDDV